MLCSRCGCWKSWARYSLEINCKFSTPQRSHVQNRTARLRDVILVNACTCTHTLPSPNSKQAQNFESVVASNRGQVRDMTSSSAPVSKHDSVVRNRHAGLSRQYMSSRQTRSTPVNVAMPEGQFGTTAWSDTPSEHHSYISTSNEV